MSLVKIKASESCAKSATFSGWRGFLVFQQATPSLLSCVKNKTFVFMSKSEAVVWAFSPLIPSI